MPNRRGLATAEINLTAAEVLLRNITYRDEGSNEIACCVNNIIKLKIKESCDDFKTLV